MRIAEVQFLRALKSRRGVPASAAPSVAPPDGEELPSDVADAVRHVRDVHFIAPAGEERHSPRRRKRVSSAERRAYASGLHGVSAGVMREESVQERDGALDEQNVPATRRQRRSCKGVQKPDASRPKSAKQNEQEQDLRHLPRQQRNLARQGPRRGAGRRAPRARPQKPGRGPLRRRARRRRRPSPGPASGRRRRDEHERARSRLRPPPSGRWPAERGRGERDRMRGCERRWAPRARQRRRHNATTSAARKGDDRRRRHVNEASTRISQERIERRWTRRDRPRGMSGAKAATRAYRPSVTSTTASETTPPRPSTEMVALSSVRREDDVDLARRARDAGAARCLVNLDIPVRMPYALARAWRRPRRSAAIAS